MESRRHSTEPPTSVSPTGPEEYKLEPSATNTPSQLLPRNLPAGSDPHPVPVPKSTIKYTALMIVPLVIHCLGSLAIIAALLFWLDPHPLYTTRNPMITLANGTEIPAQNGRYNILQSDVVTILSAALMVLRWVAGAWAGPLCWRALFLLAERHGVRRKDIKWVTSFGLLPPSRHLRHLPTLLIGIILVLSFIPFPTSPLLTGSITWVPGNNTLNDTSISTSHTIRYKGKLSYLTNSTPNGELDLDPGYLANFETRALRAYNLADSQNSSKYTIKRVTDSVANLSIGSTVQDIIMPYLHITNFTWLSEIDDNTANILTEMYLANGSDWFLPTLTQPGAAALVATPGSVEEDLWLLLNVHREDPTSDDLFWSRPCKGSILGLPENSTIPYFDLRFNFTWRSSPFNFTSCFAITKVTLTAGSAYCPRCRVTSYSTVQNETDLDRVVAERPRAAPDLAYYALKDMPLYLPTLTPFKNSLPDPVTNGLEAYARALLTRSYSALWTTWNDMTGYDSPPLTLSYQPAYPTLAGKVNRARAYTWLALQLLSTAAGVLFLCLQGVSRNPLLTDTHMIAFDLDSTEVPIPSPSNKKEHQDMLRFEWSGDRWKAVVKRTQVASDEK